MTGRLALALTLFCLSPHIQAGKIHLAQWVPWNFLLKEVRELPVSIEATESNLQLNAGELQPKLDMAHFSLNGIQKELVISSDGIYSGHEMNAQINISRLAIDQLVTREFNGNVIQVRLKAECSPISITIQNFTAETIFQFRESERGWLPYFTDSGLVIPSGGWRISSFTCSGIGGLAEEIRTSINKTLQNPAIFRDLMNNWISSRISSLLTQSWEKYSSHPEIEISSIGKPSAEGVVIFGTLRLETNAEILLPSLTQLHLSADHPQFIISKAGLEKIIESQFLKYAPEHFNLQEIAAFHDLMSSRVKQYFAWPDLRRFRSDTPFLLSTYKDQARLRLTRRGNNWQANVEANGVIRTLIGYSPIDYILFGMGISTPVSIGLNHGLLEITNQEVNLSLAWNYGLLYQLIYRPDNRIAIDILKTSLKKFFSNQRIQHKLPSLHLKDRELRLTNWQEQNEFITMDWQ